MYQSHWGIDRPPFPSGIDAHLFHETTGGREALARLRYLVDNRRRLGLVLGEPGLGKSLLLEMFARECRRQNRQVAQVDMLGITPREFYWQLATQLAAAPRPEDDASRLFRRVADRLAESRMQQLATVVLLDDVDEAGPDVLTQLLRLPRIDPTTDTWLTLVLAANDRHVSRLGSQLPELVDLRIDLQPWNEVETVGYVQLALVEAGCERPPFDDGALQILHELSGGIPRRVNRLADFALLAGSSSRLDTIDAATVQSAQDAAKWPALV